MGADLEKGHQPQCVCLVKPHSLLRNNIVSHWPGVLMTHHAPETILHVRGPCSASERKLMGTRKWGFTPAMTPTASRGDRNRWRALINVHIPFLCLIALSCLVKHAQKRRVLIPFLILQTENRCFHLSFYRFMSWWTFQKWKEDQKWRKGERGEEKGWKRTKLSYGRCQLPVMTAVIMYHRHVPIKTKTKKYCLYAYTEWYTESSLFSDIFKNS